jgi:hypothetical protein
MATVMEPPKHSPASSIDLSEKDVELAPPAETVSDPLSDSEFKALYRKRTFLFSHLTIRMRERSDRPPFRPISRLAYPQLHFLELCLAQNGYWQPAQWYAHSLTSQLCSDRS